MNLNKSFQNIPCVCGKSNIRMTEIFEQDENDIVATYQCFKCNQKYVETMDREGSNIQFYKLEQGVEQ